MPESKLRGFYPKKATEDRRELENSRNCRYRNFFSESAHQCYKFKLVLLALGADRPFCLVSKSEPILPRFLKDRGVVLEMETLERYSLKGIRQ